MTTHIDVLCGDCRSTLESNLRAVEVNEKYVAREGRVGFYGALPRVRPPRRDHGAMFLGRRRSR